MYGSAVLLKRNAMTKTPGRYIGGLVFQVFEMVLMTQFVDVSL